LFVLNKVLCKRFIDFATLFYQDCDFLFRPANNNKRMNKKDKQEQQAALIKNISENERIIFKICNSYCRNKSDREDMAQKIIYQLLKSYHSF
jgi:hypothetical protein